MAYQSRNDKNSVRYRQFQGRYAKVPKTQLRAMLEGYRLGIFRRNEVRLFAAHWEDAALHKESRVSLYRIVNCDSQRKGNRRLSQGQIDSAMAVLNEWLPKLEEKFAGRRQPTTKPVARRVLRHIARGCSTTVEGLFLFAYFMERIPQRKPLQRLKIDEHYARFRYADFENWTGVHRATQSRLMVRLIRRGYLNTVAVHKQNENAYGQLFIDGQMLSLVRRRQSNCRYRSGKSTTAPNRCEKRSTPSALLVNSPPQKRSTLINGNPKTEIKTPEMVLDLKESLFAGHADPELRRIALRAAQMTEQCHRQVA